MSKIVKIIFEDATEIEYEEKPKESFPSPWAYWKHYTDWEEDNILPRLLTNVEQWAKDQYNLMDKVDEKEIEDFTDWEIKDEFDNRGLKPKLLFNENIINQDFISRLVKIIEYGADSEIDKALEMLEKAYRIK